MGRVSALTSVFDAFNAGTMDTEEFDDALWRTLCEAVRDEADLKLLPDPVRHYYASRYLEWEVGNGGFAQAAFNVPHLFEAGRAGYAALGLMDAASLIAEAQRLIETGPAKFNADTEDIGELFAEFAGSSLAPLDQRLEEVGWWATIPRSAYALSHRKAFEGVA